MQQKWLIYFSLILLVLLAGVYYLLARSGKVETLSLSKSSISLSPDSGNYKLNDTFDVNILVDTVGKTIDGVDIFHMNYDPNILEVVDSDQNTVGVQIKQGNIFPMYLGNLVNQEKGEISISGLAQTGSEGFKGSGVFATITFKAKSIGTAKLSFDFKPKSTTDTNMVEHGTAEEILGKVDNAQFNIKAN